MRTSTNLITALDLLKRGDLENAEKTFLEMLNTHPHNAYLHHFLGITKYQKGELKHAIEHFEKAIQINPSLSEPYNNLGIIYHAMCEYKKALESYYKSLELNPYQPETYNNLANLLNDLGEIKDAIENYKKSIELNPLYLNPYLNLGKTLGLLGKYAEAIELFEKAISLNPSFTEAYWARCMWCIPIIYTDPKEIESSRNKYYESLIKLKEYISEAITLDINSCVRAIDTHLPFFLPYQQMNDRDLQVVYGEIVTKVMHAKYPQYSKPIQMMEVREGERIRVGIASAFFYHHSNWKIPIRGWVENINRDKFELFGYYTGKKDDEQTEVARRSFDHFVEGVDSFERLCERIRSDNLHVLIYPEIGMDAVILKLASLRLAPIQCTSWGHPETSGLKTIDYFLSSELMEPEDADEHYTERLVRLPNLSIYYTPIDIEPEPITRESIGINEDSVIYFCSQSLFKYLPQYDYIIPYIAKSVKECKFIFISEENRPLTEIFHKRLKTSFISFNLDPDKFLIILPRALPEYFHGILRISDVILDSIGWSGCNSTFEALQYNLPIVTIPGILMRGRHTYAILKMMGLEETIAKSIEDYIDIAVKLGKDKGFRKSISESISTKKHIINKDTSCIRGIEEFLEKIAKGNKT